MNTIKYRKLKLETGQLLLDMGCGEGRHSIGALLETPANVIGLDLSFEDLNTAKSRLNDFDLSGCDTFCAFGVGNIKNIPIENSSLDAVVCSEVLEHVDSPKESIQELVRVLKPGGINIYTVRHTDDGDYENGIFRGEDLYENDGFIVHYFSKEKIYSLLNGFSNILIENFDEGSFPRKLFYVANMKNVINQ